MHIVVRAYRIGPSTALMTLGAGVSWTLASTVQPESRYAAVPNLGPSILALCACSCLAAALLTLPRSDAAEVTAARPTQGLRALLAIGLATAILLAVAVTCHLVKSWWFFLPVARGAVLCASATFAAAAILPARFAAVTPLAYLLACYYAAHGDPWWDLVLAHPDSTNLTTTAAIATAATTTYTLIGPRRQHPHDDHE